MHKLKIVKTQYVELHEGSPRVICTTDDGQVIAVCGNLEMLNTKRILHTPPPYILKLREVDLQRSYTRVLMKHGISHWLPWTADVSITKVDE